MSNPQHHPSPRPCRARSRRTSPLTAAQRDLVATHLGLVHTHLHRYVRCSSPPRGACTHDDLFQAGCCGLIQAARLYTPQLGIPFPAFALPRIRTAINTTLRTECLPISPPRQVFRGEAVASHPRVHQLPGDAVDHRPMRPTIDLPTLGDRVRARYETIVRAVADRLSTRPTRRPDHRLLTRRIVEERLLVPEPTARTALRELARQTASSFSRVHSCDRRLVSAVRQALRNDPEFQALARLVKRLDEGIDAHIDEPTHARLQAEIDHLTRPADHGFSPNDRAA